MLSHQQFVARLGQVCTLRLLEESDDRSGALAAVLHQVGERQVRDRYELFALLFRREDAHAPQQGLAQVACSAPALSISLANGRDYIRYGSLVDYEVIVTNTGATDASAIEVGGVLPPTQVDSTFASWQCFGAGAGAVCSASGTGDLDDSGVLACAPGIAPIALDLVAGHLLDLPAVTPGQRITTVLSAPGFRLERIDLAGAVRLRLIGIDAVGRERGSAWSALPDGATLALAVVAIDGASVLLLEGTAEPLSLRPDRLLPATVEAGLGRHDPQTCH